MKNISTDIMLMKMSATVYISLTATCMSLGMKKERVNRDLRKHSVVFESREVVLSTQAVGMGSELAHVKVRVAW